MVSKKHVLFIVENDTVPNDVRVWREALVIQSLGCKVSVISPKPKICFKSYEVIENIEIYRHPVVDNLPGGLGFVAEYLNAIFWEVILCLKIFLKNPFSVIHAANPPDHIFLLAMVFRLFGIKFIFDHHDLSPELYLCKFGGKKNSVYHLLDLMEKFSCILADAIVTTNNSYRQIVIDKHHINPQKLFIVRNDPVLEATSSSKKPKNYSNQNLIKLFYLGSINTQDGVDLLVKVMSILVKEFHQEKVRCTVVGDGDGLEDAKRISTELGMNEFIHFAGYIYDRKKINELMEEADICVEPAPDNQANRFSTFIKIMEYMAAKKPVVAFKLEENRVTAGQVAILVEPGNLNQFAAAVQHLIADPLERKRLGEAAYDRILKKLNWANASKELVNAYRFIELGI